MTVVNRVSFWDHQTRRLFRWPMEYSGFRPNRRPTPNRRPFHNLFIREKDTADVRTFPHVFARRVRPPATKRIPPRIFCYYYSIVSPMIFSTSTLTRTRQGWPLFAFNYTVHPMHRARGSGFKTRTACALKMYLDDTPPRLAPIHRHVRTRYTIIIIVVNCYCYSHSVLLFFDLFPRSSQNSWHAEIK